MRLSIQNTILALIFQCACFVATAQTLPAFLATSDGLYITTANFALYKIDKKGTLVQIHPPPDDFAAALPIFNDFPERLLTGYRATDGRLVLYGDGISRKDPVFLKPKPGRKLLFVSPGISSFAVWGEGKKLIVDFYDGGYGRSLNLPDEPVAAFGKNYRMHVTCRSAASGKLSTYTTDFDETHPERRVGGLLEAGIIANDEINAVSMVTKAGVTDSVYFMINTEAAGAKPPATGKFTCLAVGAYNFVVANEKGECWMGSQNDAQQLIWHPVKLPAGAAIAGAAYIGKDDYRTGKELVMITTDNQLLWPNGPATAGSLSYTTIAVAGMQPLLAKTAVLPKPGAKPIVQPKPATPAVKTQPASNNGNALLHTLVSLGQVTFQTTRIAPYKDYYALIDGRRSYTDWPRRQQVTDLNGDGYNDLLISYTEAGYIDVLYNNGSGEFNSRSRTLLANNGSGLLAMAGHLNADKLMDIAYLSMADSSLHLLLNQGNGIYNHMGFPNLKAKWLATTDYNADGKTDLVMPGIILLNKGEASFTAFKTPSMYRSSQGFFFGTDVGPLRLSGMGDVDGNGTPDFAHPGIGKNLYDGIDIQLMPATRDLVAGKENEPLQKIKLIPPGDISSVAIGDFNGDGKADVVGSCPKQNELFFYINKGSQQFELNTIKVMGSINDNVAMIVTDADADGIEDLVVGVYGYPRVIGCTQRGGSIKTKVASGWDRKNLEMNTGAMAVGDFNGDGIIDQMAFVAHLDKVDADKSCGAEYCLALVKFVGRAEGGNLTFMGRESPNSIENLAAEAARKTAENRRRQQTSGSSSNTGTGTTTAKPVEPPANLKQGVTYYRGRSSQGLVIELEAEIWYVPKEVKGALGFSYQEIYKATCLRFRYPTTSNRWFSGGGNELYKCYKDSYSIGCFAVGGMVFEVSQTNRL